MAKTQWSKSEAIREYIAKHPSAGPTEIYNALTKQGIAVSKGLVAVVKYKKPSGESTGKKPGPAKKAGRPAASAASATPAAASRSALSIDDLVAAKELVDLLGGVAKTRDVLALLEKLA